MPTRGPVRVAASWQTAAKKGTPDHVPAVLAGKLIVGITQESFTARWFTTIPIDDTDTLALYTVPDGYKLTIGTVIISCNISAINTMYFYTVVGGVITGYLLSEFLYDMEGSIDLGPQSAVEAVAGDIVTMTVTNETGFVADVSVTVQGFLEEVE